MAERLSPEEAEEKKTHMTETSTKSVDDSEIQAHIQAKNIDIGATTFEVEVRELDEKDADSSDTSSNSNAFSQKVQFGDGKVGVLNIILTPIEQAMSLNTGELDEKKKAAIEAKARKSKAAREKLSEEIEQEKDR